MCLTPIYTILYRKTHCFVSGVEVRLIADVVCVDVLLLSDCADAYPYGTLTVGKRMGRGNIASHLQRVQ